MVTYEQLRERLGLRPFRPFRMVLSDGETIDIVRLAQAVAMKRRVVVASDEEGFRWIWLDQVDRIESPAPAQA